MEVYDIFITKLRIGIKLEGIHTCIQESIILEAKDVKEEQKDWLRKRAMDSDYTSAAKLAEKCYQTFKERYPGITLIEENKNQMINLVSNTRSKENTDGILLPPYSVFPDRKNWLRQFCIYVNHDSKSNETSKIYVWANPALISIAKGNNVRAYMDGTFRICPKGFEQVMVLMIFDQQTDVYVPVFYGLLDSKTSHAYWKFLSICIEATDCNFFPASVTCDFEPAEIKAIERKIILRNLLI